MMEHNLQHSEELKSTYNRIAQDYTKDHEGDTWDNDFTDLFASSLPSRAAILDLGCGPGRETYLLSQRGFKLTGFDLSPELLAIAKKQTPEATFVEGDMMRPLPFETDSFDGVFAKASLLHIPKQKLDEVLHEIVRVLTPHGLLHVALKGGEGERTILENDYGYEYQRFFAFWTPDELIRLFDTHNLKVERFDAWKNPGTQTVWLKYLLRLSMS